MGSHMAKTQNGICHATPVVLLFLLSISCTGPDWNAEQSVELYTISPSNLASVLKPEPEDVPYFKAIAEDQEKQLGLCKEEDACRSIHFLLGLSALYENRELAALHFRKVVVSRPNSVLAGESGCYDRRLPLCKATISPSNLASVLKPEPEDVPYFKAIAEDQEKQLGLCKEEDACRRIHFLLGLSALYENREWPWLGRHCQL